MYDPKQLVRDLKTLCYSMGEIKPHGFYSKSVFEKNNLQIEITYQGVLATFKGLPIDVHNVPMESELAKLILSLIVDYEGRYFVPVVKCPTRGSITTYYDLMRKFKV